MHFRTSLCQNNYFLVGITSKNDCSKLITIKKKRKKNNRECQNQVKRTNKNHNSVENVTKLTHTPVNNQCKDLGSTHMPKVIHVHLLDQ